MTLRHMRIFITVCETNNITRAACKLFLAQPAVSLAIKELEGYYGVRLFERIGKKLYITEDGKNILSYASQIIALFDEMENSVSNRDTIGTLRIGASITIGTHFMPKYVKYFSSLYPKINVNVFINSSDIIENKLLSNNLDFGLIEGSVHSPYLISESYMKDKLIAICSSGHPFCEREKISAEEFAAQPLLLREKGSGTRELFDRVFSDFSITPSWESTSTEAIIQAVIQGVGVSVLPFHLVEDELRKNEIKAVEISGMKFSRRFSIIYHKNKHITNAMSTFFDICKNQQK
ncbi:MAG: LysR family transcriptional regulator [Clostridia bacterium]|nr:LysR family transcriptional regulator [Clostridia bacterium]